MMNYNVFGKLLGLVAIVLVLSSCTGVKVTSDYDKRVDFTQYKTYEYYGWAEESDKILNDLDKRRIEQAFGAELKARGLEYVESGGDLVVTLFIVVEQKSETVANTTSMGGYGGHGYYGGYYGYGPGYGWGAGHSTTTVNTYDYEVGTLVCDVFDKASEKLIWEGIGSGTVDEKKENRERNIEKAVSAIMATYPVMPIKDK